MDQTLRRKPDHITDVLWTELIREVLAIKKEIAGGLEKLLSEVER